MSALLENLAQNQQKLADTFNRSGVVLAYLFGSQARGDAGPLSDIDIAILFSSAVAKDERLHRVLKLMVELGNLLGREDIQVVDLEAASPLLRQRVYYSGKRLYSIDEETRVRFELKALRDYVNTEPLRRIKRKYVLERFKVSTGEES